MYPYNYNLRGNQINSIYTPAVEANDERLIGGFVGPLLLGGVAGYAIGANNNYNNRPYMFYAQPYNPYYYNNYYPYYYGRRW